MVEDQEPADVGPFQLFQPADVGVVGGQVLAEDDETVGSHEDRGGPQGGGHYLQVAQDDTTDLRLWQGFESLGQRGFPGSVLAGRGRADAQLVASLVETERPGVVVAIERREPPRARR